MRSLIALVLVAGCTVGGDPGTGGGGGGGDDGDGSGRGGDVTQPDGGVDMPDGSTVGGPDAAVFMCRDKVPLANLSSGHHNPGQDCLNGCHNHGFTLAGTLYTTAAGGTVAKGGTITVVDADAQTFDMVSQANGNFYSTRPVTFPVKVTASMCPDVKPMSGSITQGNGGCNKSGCHVAGGTGRVHVP